MGVRVLVVDDDAVLHALWVLARAGFLHDPRLDEAVELVAARRRSDGL
jgi:hypothetical protein